MGSKFRKGSVVIPEPGEMVSISKERVLTENNSANAGEPLADQIGEFAYESLTGIKKAHYSPQQNAPSRIEVRSRKTGSSEPVYTSNPFIITDVSRDTEERAVVISTFSGDLLFNYGQKPKFYSFQATIIAKSGNGDWIKRWSEDYEKFLRMELLIRRNQVLYLFYGNKIVQGYLLGYSTQETGNHDIGTLAFSMYVTREDFIPTVDIWRIGENVYSTGEVNAIGDGSDFSNLA
jgi:hypothetical protein